MSASISNATANQQYFTQVAQNNPNTPDAGNGAVDAKGKGAPPPPPPGPPPGGSSGSSSNGTRESACTRNADGTYGPDHIIDPPANSAAADAAKAAKIGIDITV